LFVAFADWIPIPNIVYTLVAFETTFLKF
jgi:hypothetical protein